jgi:hypothetical protein
VQGKFALADLRRVGSLPRSFRKIKRLAENTRNWAKLYVIDIVVFSEGLACPTGKKGDLKNAT